MIDFTYISDFLSQYNRGTGRTHNMIKYAPPNALVVAWDSSHKKNLVKKAFYLDRTDLDFVTIDGFDNRTRGRGPEDVVFDHHTIAMMLIEYYKKYEEIYNKGFQSGIDFVAMKEHERIINLKDKQNAYN